MVTAAISAAAALGSALYGGIKSSRANREYESMIRGRMLDNERWYNIKKSQDYTRRSDVQAENTKLRELLEKMTDRARATNVVAGGTDQSLASSLASANSSIAQAYADSAARASEYNDAIEREYRQQESALVQQREKNLQQQAANAAQAASQSTNSGLRLLGNSFDLEKSNA